MKNSIFAIATFLITQASHAGMTGGHGGVFPKFVMSVESKEGNSTFALGTYNNSDWKVDTISVPTESIPKNVSHALEKSEATKNWVQIEK